MKFKINSKFLVGSILLNSFILNSSFASTLSEDTRYETFEEESIEITDILESDNIDVEVSGNTLVNLVEYNGASHPWGIFDGEFVTFTNPQAPSNVAFNLNGLKPDTTYTVIFNITQMFEGDGYIRYDLFPDTFEELGQKNTLGLVKHKFTTYSDLSTFETFRFYVPMAMTGTCKVTKPMVLEGDWTNKEVPEHFWGLSSVGQAENNNIQLTVNNKNILPELEYGNISETGENQNNGNNTWYRTKGYLKIKPGSILTYSLDGVYRAVNGYVYDEHKNFIQKIYVNGTSIQLPSNAHYFRFSHFVDTSDKLQLEYGSNITDYMAPDRRVINIKLKEPLRSIPGVTKDRIIKKGGQWMVERNCKEVVFDGSTDENWDIYTNNTLGNIVHYIRTPDMNVKKDEGPVVLSDRLKYERWGYRKDSENISTWGNSTNIPNIYINLLPDTLGSDSFKTWLSKNPVKVIYQLSEPTYEPMKEDLLVLLNKEVTYIDANSNVQPILKTTVDRVSNRARDFISVAKANPTIENVSQARYWANLMNETLLKDDYVGDLNEITEIKELSIEKKKVTANVDLYIRSENNLSISLDTNNILFDNYNGVNDIEMLSAVDITVNSSLPYDLNAYLPEGIVNEDNTQSIPINALNIKDNTESTYKQFVSTSDKVVLKDNCSAGSNQIHSIDFKLASSQTHKADVYKTVVRFEAEQR